jgi:signal transduction histidine kinase
MGVAFEETIPQAGIADVQLSAARWRGLLALTVLLMSAVLWGTWFEITTHERREALQAAARRQGNLMIALGHYLTRALSNADAVAQFLARAHAAPDTDFPAELVARARANDLFSEMTTCFVDASFVTTAAKGDQDGTVRRCAQWLQQAPAGARTFAADPVLLAGDTLVPLLTRVPPGSTRPGGVIALLVDVRKLLGLLEEYRIPDETVVLVAGSDGRPKARWHSTRQVADQRAPEAALLAPVLAAGTLGQPQLVEGRPVIASARRMQAWPLAISVATSEADTLAVPVRRSFYYALAAAAATLLLAAFAYVLLRFQQRVVRVSDSLGRARQRLHLVNTDLEGQVSARTSELEAAYQDLESFSDAVAHDVRAPIAAIRGFADALAPGIEATGDPKAAHYLRRILANATQMSELAEALLALGKLSRPSGEVMRVDLSSTALEVLAGLREREPPQREVQATVQEGLAVRGDRVLVRQVLENLLANAWKFSARRSPAVIAVEGTVDAHGWMTVTVRDNGEGFDMANATELFKPFRRMHAAGEFAGTGVGLAIVERIVRLHGGRTWIASTPQRGTTVSFRLPAASLAQPD